MKIGLTFFLRTGERSIWASGATQQCVFLLMLLRRCPEVEKVYAINGGDGDVPPRGMMLGALPFEFVRFDEVADQLDLLIEAEAQIEPRMAAHVQARGGRAVAYRFGNAFVIDSERVIHGKPAGSIFNGTRFDEVWTNPQHAPSCKSYWEVCYRAPVRVLPHVWEPLFIALAEQEFKDGLRFGYQPGRAAKRVAIMEPNVNIVKTSAVPMLACEVAYRQRPDLLGDVYVTNAEHLKVHLTFRKFAANLDIVRNGKASFEARYNTPWFLAKHADVVVAHQWENSLNFAYYDALHGRYPLVHNSPMLPVGVGYRYDGFDCHGAGSALLDALVHHDERRAVYDANAARFLATVRTDHPANVAAYSAALEGEPLP